MEGNVTKGPAPNIKACSSAPMHQWKNSSETNSRSLYEYKEKFNQFDLDVGFKRPCMGGTNWKEQNTCSSSQLEMKTANILSLSQKPLINLLHVPGVQERGMLTRFFYYTYITTSRRTNHNYPSIEYMKQKVLSDEKLHHAIQKTMYSDGEGINSDSDCDQYLESRLQLKAKSLLNEMVATVTSKALKFCGWLFLTLLRQLTSSVHLHEGQLDVLRVLSQGNAPILYLPLHYSHFDYILLSLLLYHNEIRSPFVASGNNLYIPPFSTIMRRVGGFFIRRKIDKGVGKDHIYRAILHSYVTELLKKNQSLEIFIEGTRTRSGLPNQPKTGLLSVVVEALQRGDIPDVILVPLSVSYEKLMEGDFDNELMGQPKTPETFLYSIFTIAKMLCGFYGHIRVNFGAPQSLKKTLIELRSSPSCSFPSSSDLPLPRSRSLYEQVTSTEDCNKMMRKSSSSPSVDASLPPHMNINARLHLHKMTSPASSPILGGNLDDDDTREIVTLLGERVIYNCVKCKAHMSTSLVAFLLLHRWRNGVTMPLLVESFTNLVMELLTRKIDIGFSGDFHEVVLHAVNLLGVDLVQLDCARSTNSRSRASSSASVRSRHSADSGYDLEDVASPTTPDEGKSPMHEKDQSSSDSGEEMMEQDEMSTGVYMSMSESGISMNDPLSSTIVKIPAPQHSVPQESSKNDLCLFIKPVLDVPQVFELSYYGNALTPTFALESIVALAVGAVTSYRFSTLEKQLQECNERCLRFEAELLPEGIRTSFLRSDLFDRALELVDILQMDLILCDVTTNMENAVNAAIDGLISGGSLTSQEYGVSAATRQSEAVHGLSFDDDGGEHDQWLKINLENVLQLITMQSIMAGFVEGYVVACSQLSCLLETSLSETLLKERILSASQDRVKTGLAIRSESSSSDIVRNALRSFEWNGIIISFEKNKKSFRLSEDFTDPESISNLVSRISQFLL